MAKSGTEQKRQAYSVKVLETQEFLQDKQHYTGRIKAAFDEIKKEGGRPIGYATDPKTNVTFFVYASQKSEVPNGYEIRTSGLVRPHAADPELKGRIMAEISDMKEREKIFVLKKGEVL
ncbi:MAG: hypothetical protein QXD77_03050 [Candidatus Aenigmatarchaeota archaeon]